MLRVLVVDDEDTCLTILVALLECLHLIVVTASSFQQAKEMLATSREDGQRPFDLMITDQRLDMNNLGTDLVTWLRDQSCLSLSDMPVILCSGSLDTDRPDLSKCDASLQKPVTQVELEKAITQAMKAAMHRAAELA